MAFVWDEAEKLLNVGFVVGTVKFLDYLCSLRVENILEFSNV